MRQISRKNLIPVITILLLLVSVLLLLKLHLQLNLLYEDLETQGEKIATLYNFVDAEIDLESKRTYPEEKIRQNEIDKKTALKKVNEFKSSNFTTKAKFNPKDNTFAIVVGDGSVQILNAETSELVQTLREPDEVTMAITYLPDGKQLLAGMKSGKLYLWSLETNESKFIKQIGESGIIRLDASKNNRIALGLDGSYEESKKKKLGTVIDISTGEILSEYSATFRDDFKGLAISADGEIVIIDEVHGKLRGACLFNASDGTELKLLYHRNYGCGPLSVDIASDNRTVAVGYAPYHVIVWDSKEGTIKWLFEQHSNWVVSLDFSDNNRFLASGAGDSTARVYNLSTGKQIGCVRFPGSSTYVDLVDISADGKLLLAAVDGYIGIYRMPND